MKKGFASMRCALLGEHLGHSFSPQIHAALTDYTYDLVERPRDEVEEFVKHGGYDCFNVTIPYKQTVIPFLDTISPEAERIGAVNTVVRDKDGTLHGYNTDYFGFSYMIDRLGLSVKGKKAIVLGRGGASHTACTVLRDRGVRELIVFGSRDNTLENLFPHTDTEIIVNATPVGMFPHTGHTPVDLSLFPHCIAVLDMIYNPARPALLLDAEARGIPYINGLSMLVAQAVKAFEFFTGDGSQFSMIETITADIRKQTENIILIGMPGCGKSTVGQLLAQRMERPFYDADEEFLKCFGVTPAQVIESKGEETFRKMEHEVLCELGKQSGTVIVCGGGAVTRETNYHPLHQNGVIVYLQRELSLLCTKGRPLSQTRTPEALYRERKEKYEAFADITVQSTEVPTQTAAVIQQGFELFLEPGTENAHENFSH